CGVMTGVGAALNIGTIGYGDTVMVIGCGAVGLSAVQGARLAGAGEIIAVDLDAGKLALAERVGATSVVDAGSEDPTAIARAKTAGRGADVVFEAAGSPDSFRASVEAVRPGGEVIWLGKTDVAHELAFRWGSLMGEKRSRRAIFPSSPAPTSTASSCSTNWSRAASRSTTSTTALPHCSAARRSAA